MRWLVAILMVVLPLAICVSLLRLGEVDWRQCFDAMGSIGQRPNTLYPTWSAAVEDILASAFTDLRHPLVFALLIGPFAGFAMICALARTQTVFWANFMACCLWVAVVAYSFIDPTTHHDCDRKGTDAIFAFFLFAPTGLLISGVVAAIAARHHKSKSPINSDT